MEPPISNVSPRPKELTRLGISVLFDRIDGGDPPPRFELVSPKPLTRRESTARF